MDNSYLKDLLGKIRDYSAVVGVVGLGYVGLPLLLRFAEEGFPVLGFDIDKTKIEKLLAGRSYFKHISSAKVAKAISNGKLNATIDFSRALEADVLIICVPTPLTIHREPDLSYVEKTMDELVPYLRAGQAISLESTTYPGTTDEVIKPRIEQRGLVTGENIFLIYSPEREDPGNQSFSTQTIPKVCGGYSKACLEVGIALYGQVISQVVPVSSTKAAEMTKLLENIYRAVNIGLVNELKIVADQMGIDIWEVIDAAATKPFGYTPFYPGPGLGGHCIPIDPFYLTWKAREYGIHTRFIELAGEINTAMPSWVITKVADALNQKGKPLQGAKVLILGIAYKKNVDDMRESPALELLELLQKKGSEISYSDPHVPKIPTMRKYSFDLESTVLSAKTLSESDCVLIVTNHDDFDYELIAENASLIIDTRGVYKTSLPNVIKA